MYFGTITITDIFLKTVFSNELSQDNSTVSYNIDSTEVRSNELNEPKKLSRETQFTIDECFESL